MSHGGLPTTMWMGLYAALAGGLGGILLAMLWTPFLASERIRTLFRIGPTQWLPVNYTLGFIGLSALHAGLLGAWIESGFTPTSSLNAVVWMSLAVPGTAWAAAVWGLPALGYPWDRMHDDHRSTVLLAGGAVWYAVLTAVPGIIASLIAAFPA